MDRPCSPARQAEAAAKAKAKEDLKAFLLSNEVNKKVPRGGEAAHERWWALEVGRGQAVTARPRWRYREMPLDAMPLGNACAIVACKHRLASPSCSPFPHPAAALPCPAAAAQIKEEEAEKERLQDLEYMRQQAAQLWVALLGGEGVGCLRCECVTLSHGQQQRP